jgi:hypothetical protein
MSCNLVIVYSWLIKSRSFLFLDFNPISAKEQFSCAALSQISSPSLFRLTARLVATFVNYRCATRLVRQTTFTETPSVASSNHNLWTFKGQLYANYFLLYIFCLITRKTTLLFQLFLFIFKIELLSVTLNFFQNNLS